MTDTDTKLDDLFDALDTYGDENGTESQLDKLSDLVRSIFDPLTEEVALQLLDIKDVDVFLKAYAPGY